MGFPVRYTCPRCGAVVTLERKGYLADKSVTEAPLTGWEYTPAYEPFEDGDGVELVCGASETEGEGCGRPFYLSFLKYDDGQEVEGDAPLRPEDAPRFDFRH